MRRGKAYPLEIRQRVVELCEMERSHTWEEAARLFGVGIATVNRWIALYRQTGSVDPRPRGGGQPLRADDQVVREIVEARSDATRQEIAKEHKKRTGIALSVASIGRSLMRLGYTRKKRQWSLASAIARPSSRPARDSPKKSVQSRRIGSSFSTRPARTSR